MKIEINLDENYCCKEVKINGKNIGFGITKLNLLLDADKPKIDLLINENVFNDFGVLKEDERFYNNKKTLDNKIINLYTNYENSKK